MVGICLAVNSGGSLSMWVYKKNDKIVIKGKQLSKDRTLH